jgi:hypothetical protein
MNTVRWGMIGAGDVCRVRELIAEGAVGQSTGMSINNKFPTSHRLDLVLYLLGEIRADR